MTYFDEDEGEGDLYKFVIFSNAILSIIGGGFQLARYIKQQKQIRLLEEQKQEEEARRRWREEYTCPPFLDQKNINIGICGGTGTGKSTLINTLLGKKSEQPGAARVGVNECTMEPVPHEAPQNGHLQNKLIFWDLPGAGSVKFPLHDYIQKFGTRWFDTIVVVGDTRVREIDVNLVKECERTNVRHLYVRTKMDQTVEDNKGSAKNDHETFDAVRRYLQESGIKNPYLIGRRYVESLSRGAWQNTEFKRFVKDLFETTQDSALLNEKMGQQNK
eukprot:TRINITY_DN8027_c0_g1_i1.p1 TRINITY_DN8027_c0_g1~~TRINITY_DN8027_c0_g1_i1.p1  ORF type:complete len:274 (-),score=26.43 TRINITY_DN8027_c0_g1_i1:171-992(-)